MSVLYKLNTIWYLVFYISLRLNVYKIVFLYSLKFAQDEDK